MKKNYVLSIALFTMLTIVSKLSYGQANTSLSNLTNPTSVNVSLLPKNNNTQNLGSTGKSWRILYIDSSIYLKDVLFLHNNGSQNTFVGENAGKLVTGSGNTANGYNALSINTGGIWNAAMGAYTLYSNINGSVNSAFGYKTMYSNTTGEGNTAVGGEALYSNTTGMYNTAIGEDALLFHKKGNNNVALGAESLHTDSSGSDNVGIGNEALFVNKSGVGNTAIGSNALFNIQNNNFNTAIGYGAGNYYNGHDNTFLGAFTYATTNDFYNSTVIGSNASFTASNQVRIGNSSVGSIGGQVSWTTLSDGRVKKNIKQNVPGLSFINRLNPVTYNLNLDAIDNIIKTVSPKDEKGNIIKHSKQELDARKAKEEFVYTGLIAQDVEKAAKESGYNFSGVDAAKNDHDLYGLRYSDFVMPLIKSVQELSKQNDELKSTNEDLEKKYEAQQEQINELKALITHSNQRSIVSNQQKNSLPQSAKLEQNQPNPTTQSTIIKYFIPEQSSNAVIRITNSNGQEVQSIDITQKNNGQVTLQTNDLASGTYFYSLISDGKTVDTKKMVIAH